MPKIAVVPPMPSANVRTESSRYCGRLRKPRSAKRASMIQLSSPSPPCRMRFASDSKPVVPRNHERPSAPGKEPSACRHSQLRALSTPSLAHRCSYSRATSSNTSARSAGCCSQPSSAAGRRGRLGGFKFFYIVEMVSAETRAKAFDAAFQRMVGSDRSVSADHHRESKGAGRTYSDQTEVGTAPFQLIQQRDRETPTRCPKRVAQCNAATHHVDQAFVRDADPGRTIQLGPRKRIRIESLQVR